MRNPSAGYKHSDPAHRQFGLTADSSLLRKRYAAGGLVTREHEPSLEEELFNERMRDIDEQGRGSPKEYELERNRGESVIQDSESKIDPNWKANETEDI